MKKVVTYSFFYILKTAEHAGTEKKSRAQEPHPVDGQTGEKGKDDDSADEEQSSKSAVLGNIPDSVTTEFLEMLVENILKDLSSLSDSQDYTLELIPDISSAVVTLQSGKGTHLFMHLT